MMIDVKGTDKAAKPTAAVATYERYALKSEDGRSSTPLYFGIFLTSLALYLKSVLPSWSEPMPQAEPARHPDDASGAQRHGGGREPIAVASTDDYGRAEPARPMEQQSAAPAQPVNLAEAPPLRLFASPLAEVPLLDFAHLDLRQFGQMSFTLQAANDNGGSSAVIASAGPGADAGPDSSEKSKDDDEDEERVNRAPRASGPVRLGEAYSVNLALIGLADLLRNASDPDGDALRVEGVTVSSGELIQIPSGWAYSAEALGPVTITYRISDGHSTIVQTATLSVLQGPAIVGTDKADELAGSMFSDEINGGGGADKINALGGDDVITAAEGDDQIAGGIGDDVIHAGNGNDMVLGGAGNDQIWGGDGDDRLAGEAGRDTIFGDAGDDTIQGGNDDDTLSGGAGRDTVYGDAGNDTVRGDGGNDLLQGGAGKDVVDGGADNDRIVGDADRADDGYDGGTGEDTLDYSAITGALHIDAAAGSASGAEIGRDKIARFETVRAGSGNDTIAGGAGGEQLEGRAGNDSIAGGGGDDDLVGDTGEDTLRGGQGSDLVHGDAGNDWLSGDEGSDMVYGDAGDDVVRGDRDQVNDIYNGGAGVDTLDYSAAMMAVAISLAEGKAAGSEIGQDFVVGFEVIKSGAGNDTLIGGTGNDVIADGSGRDSVSAGLGDDRVIAADDGVDDVYNGGDGSDTIDYSQSATGVLINLATGEATGLEIGKDAISGFDVAIGGSGNDSFVIGPSATVLEGGAGFDNFEFQLPPSGASDLIHQIMDFMVGDRISVSKYQMFEDVMDDLNDQFEQVYGDQDASQTMPIRVLHERTDEMEQTLIQIDMDRDDHYEMTINLSGHHMLMIVENA